MEITANAVRRDVARLVLPLVRDTGWFFDTELLVIAERAGLRIHEVPVDWTCAGSPGCGAPCATARSRSPTRGRAWAAAR